MSEGVSNDSPVPSPKQGRLISKINKAIETKTPFYSFEFFPPKTTAGTACQQPYLADPILL